MKLQKELVLAEAWGEGRYAQAVADLAAFRLAHGRMTAKTLLRLAQESNDAFLVYGARLWFGTAVSWNSEGVRSKS